MCLESVLFVVVSPRTFCNISVYQPYRVSPQMAARGITVKDVPADAFIAAYARYLKRSGKFDVPKWTDQVKTAHFKELGPLNPDWYFVRAGKSNTGSCLVVHMLTILRIFHSLRCSQTLRPWKHWCWWFP